MKSQGFDKLRITLATAGTVLASLFGGVMRSARASTNLPVAYTSSTRWHVQSSDCATGLGVAGNVCGIGVRQFAMPAQVTTSPGVTTTPPITTSPGLTTSPGFTTSPVVTTWMTGFTGPSTNNNSSSPGDTSPPPATSNNADDRFNLAAQTNNTIAFDNSLGLAVNGSVFTAPGGRVDLSGDILTTEPQIISGVIVDVQYQFSGPSRTVRAVYMFHNTNSFPASIPVNTNIGGFGAGAGIQTSSSGDDAPTPADRWFATKGNNSKGPSVLFVADGNGASTELRSVTHVSNNYIASYNIAIQAGDTVAIMVFAQANGRAPTAATVDATFADLAALNFANLLADLPIATNKIINWSGPGWAPPPLSPPKSLPEIDEARLPGEIKSGEIK